MHFAADGPAGAFDLFVPRVTDDDDDMSAL